MLLWRPTGLIYGYNIGVNLTCSNEREEVPQWGFTVLFTMSLILHCGIIPNHPLSGGNEAYSERGQGVTCFLWNLIIISAVPPALNIIKHEGQLLSGKEDCFTPHPPKTQPRVNVFSYSLVASYTSPGMSYLLMLNYCTKCGQMISADNVQVFGQQQTWGYDLKCHKELFYIKEIGGGRWLWLHWAL